MGERVVPLLDDLTSWDTGGHPAYNLWGTGNVEEVLPGITRPLSADVISTYMEIYARRLVSEAGLGDQVVVATLPEANIFGFFGGRWAVNIAWLGAYVGSYQPEESSDMLGQFMRGGRTASGISENTRRALRTRGKIERLWATALARTPQRAAVAHRARLAALRAALRRESDARLLERVDRTIALTGGLFVDHAYVSIGGAEQLAPLSSLLDRTFPGHPPEWGTVLTSALRDLTSAAPVAAIWKLSRAARKSAAVAKAIEHEPVDVLRERLESPPDAAWHRFAAAFAEFDESLGFRGQREVDPSVPDWGEDPSFVLSALRATISLPATKDPVRQEERAARERERLEARIERRLSEEDAKRFRVLLDDAQRYVRGRERTKATWAEASRAFRPPLRELGRRLAERDLIAAEEDVFFLRLAELRQAVAGALDGATAKERVRIRREEYERLHALELPVTFELPLTLEHTAAVTPAGATLTGMGVSAGVATGRARIVMNAEAGDEALIEPGEILVAPYTDAPWTPLFWPAAGVVVERGGMLSHASTVAREFGIPAVVAVQGATTLIPPGALVTVDGNTGTVTIQA
ncbi:MAG: hypothetical protein IT304_08545 [Dehalococcoidia bacterium]|nr:hypothetical protein [Dehalococcoidia bacterium]